MPHVTIRPAAIDAAHYQNLLTAARKGLEHLGPDDLVNVAASLRELQAALAKGEATQVPDAVPAESAKA